MCHRGHNHLCLRINQCKWHVHYLWAGLICKPCSLHVLTCMVLREVLAKLASNPSKLWMAQQDLYIWGPPCQPYSQLNMKRQREDYDPMTEPQVRPFKLGIKHIRALLVFSKQKAVKAHPSTPEIAIASGPWHDIVDGPFRCICWSNSKRRRDIFVSLSHLPLHFLCCIPHTSHEASKSRWLLWWRRPWLWQLGGSQQMSKFKLKVVLVITTKTWDPESRYQKNRLFRLRKVEGQFQINRAGGRNFGDVML